jgi:hypothetical protein
MLSFARGSLLVTVIVTAAACESSALTVSPDKPEARRTNASERVSNGPPALDGELVRLAHAVPGFGGYHFDESGRAVAYLTDMSQAPLITQALGQVLGQRRFGVEIQVSL